MSDDEMGGKPGFVSDLEKVRRKRWDKKAKETFERVKDRVGKGGEMYRWTGDARVLWPDDSVSHYKTIRSARAALTRKGYSRGWFGDLGDAFAIIITDVWTERWERM